MSIKDSLAVDEMGGENAHERNASRGRTTLSHTHSKNRGVTSPPEA